MTENGLVVSHVYKSYGAINVINDLSFTVKEHSITALVGPNGAGKTTVFNLITGTDPLDSGMVSWKGTVLTGLKPYVIARHGVARTYQDLRLFGSMTVRENVQVVMETSFKDGFGHRKKMIRERTDSILKSVGLLGVGSRRVEELSYAEKKFLSLARLLATTADLLLLDEPASGLDSTSQGDFVTFVRSLPTHAKTVCLVEHNLELVRNLAEEVIFMDSGYALRKGRPEDIMKDPELGAIYFGGVHEDE